MKSLKKRLLASVLALTLCFSTLLGTTFAWFTDVVVSKSNIIQSGRLDAEMYYSDELLDVSSANWQNAEFGAVFTHTNWEAGYTDVKYVMVKNAGNLAFKWNLSIKAQDQVTDLADVIDVYYVNPVETTLTSLNGLTKAGVLSNVIQNNVSTSGTLLPSGESSTSHPSGAQILAIALHMHESAGNEYQNASVGSGFALSLVATQLSYEEDAFGDDYDQDATFPEVSIVGSTSVSAPVTSDANGNLSSATSLTSTDGKISSTVPEGVALEDGTNQLTLTVSDVAESQANLTISETEATFSIDVHVTGVSETNAVIIPVEIKELLPVGLNMGNHHLYHVENGETVEMTLLNGSSTPVHNNYEYNPATGDVVLYLKSFSEVAVVADTNNAWEGAYDDSWYDAKATELTIANADQLATLSAIVGGMKFTVKGVEKQHEADSFSKKTITLLADINLGDKESENKPNLIFYPIGYYNTDGTYEKTGTAITSGFKNFEGTFDGNGNTISNFYQNTWEMKGDHNWYDPALQYYRDGMGLFGKVYGGTVKNLTVDNFSCDGEIATTGTIAAYADGATFENIAITNCNPRVYNIGNGGIVGCVGWYAEEEGFKTTFKNITVDNSNKISALWGSYDVACGGIVGQYYPTSGQTSAGSPKNAGIDLVNCHVSAQMDVYNDVCGNYQYYAYRYAGILIGSVRENETIDGHVYPKMDGITAESCTVHFGTWNDYYYCELASNGKASYTHDHKMTRLTEIKAIDGTTITYLDGKTGTVPTSGRANYVIVDYTKGHGTENATCYHFLNGEVWEHEDGGYETTDINGDGVVDSNVLKEDKQCVYLEFNNLVTGYGWGATSKVIGDFDGVTILDREVADSVEKFETKFTGNFLYRVGNQNEFNIGYLFAEIYSEKNPVIDSGVWVSVTNIAGDAAGSFAADTTDWTKGTIQFSGTGVVKVTIQDYFFCTPTELLLEVVDAKNATTATSATANNVVLLNDISGTFVVSNGYTFYGNGFTVTLPTTSVQNVGNGFTGYISIGAAQDDGIANGGNLDNVRIEGPVYPEMYIYRDQAKITDSSDPDYGDSYNMRYFKNSVIVYGGNVNISNCYISGSRTALCLRGGNNVVIENTTLSGGSYANMQICAGSNVTLRDLTTVQIDKTDSYEKEKTAHGLGIAVDSAVVDIYIEGELNQHNWISQSQWEDMLPTIYQKVFPEFFTNDDFKENWHYLNGEDEKYVNLAFIFACNWDTDKIHDNRTTVDYGTTDATINEVDGGVYTKINTVGGNAITDTNLAEPSYTSPGFNPIAPSLNFDNAPNHDEDDENDAQDTYCVYDEASGTLKIGVTSDSKVIDLSNVSVTKNGVNLDYTKYLNGTEIFGTSVTIKAADGAKQTLTFKATSNDAGYDKDGNPIDGSIEYSWTVTVEIATLAYPAPVWNMGGDYEFDKTNCVYAYYATTQGYGEAVQIYEGIKINYYDKSGKLVELDLSGTTTHPIGSENSNSNAFTYTLDDGSTLTMKFSSGWKSGATTHQFTTYKNKVYIYPQSLDNDNYVRAKTTNQNFDVKITYNFTDPNGQSTGNQTMCWYNAMGSNGDVTTVQWKTFDSTNGKKPSTCITPDTLITLADGSQVRVDSLAGTEELLVWNLETGMLDKAPIGYIVNHNGVVSEREITHLTFSNGKTVKIIGEHVFFDVTQNKYVALDEYNSSSFIGHSFATLKADGSGIETAELVSVKTTVEQTAVYEIVSQTHLTCFTEGVLSTSAYLDHLLNIFDIDSNTFAYNAESVQADIETYGVYTYADFEGLLPETAFHFYNVQYLKIAVGKGYITWEEILELIDIYFDVEVPL